MTILRVLACLIIADLVLTIFFLAADKREAKQIEKTRASLKSYQDALRSYNKELDEDRERLERDEKAMKEEQEEMKFLLHAWEGIHDKGRETSN